jgi:predicted secreted protein
MKSTSEILDSYEKQMFERTVVSTDERRALLQDLVDATGYPLWKILKRTAGMQDVKTLRYILSAMKQVSGDGAHRFNKILFVKK